MSESHRYFTNIQVVSLNRVELCCSADLFGIGMVDSLCAPVATKPGT